MPVISSGYAFLPNQSINGIVHRWLGHPPVFTLGPSDNIVSFATYLATIFFSLTAICPRSFSLRPKNNDHASNTLLKTDTFTLRLTDIGIAILAISLASPIAWEHHFAWTIVLFAACMAMILSTDIMAIHIPPIVISYILLGTYLLPFRIASSGWLSLINSLPFAGAVILLACLWSINRTLLKNHKTSQDCPKNSY